MSPLEPPLPASISPSVAAGLVLLSLLTSGITGALGIGGGMVLLSGFGFALPPAAVIPVHAVVQVGSNASRAALLISQVDRRALLWFLPGAALGALIGGLLVVDLPAPLLRGAVGTFVLVTAWTKPGSLPGGPLPLVFGGLLSSVLTMFVGATGPFVVALLRGSNLEPRPLVATSAVAMVAQHGLKVVAFGLLGFPLRPWLPLLGAMIAAGVVGTWLGAKLLHRLPKPVFIAALRALLTLAGAGLLAGAVGGALTA